MALQTPSSQASEEFILAYGDAMVQWSNLEVILALWFRKVTLMPSWEAARAVFFSARSFQGRSDMFSAALDHLEVDEERRDDLTFLQEAISKAISYSSVRNKLAHGFVHGSEAGESITAPKHFGKPGDMTLKEVRNAAANFAELRRVLYAPLKGKDQGRKSTTECLERLRQLPSEACSSELSQKQKGRLRQRLAALRKKAQQQ